VRWPRRALAFSALGAALLAAWIVTRHAIWPDRHGAQVSHFSFDSHYLQHEVEVTVVVPKAGAAHRPLLVFLHGRGGDQDSELRNGPLFRTLAALGRRAPVIAFPYGGKDSYWHDRRSGKWGRFVTREVIHAVIRRFHTDPSRIALGGISMGGFGALDIARRRPGRFCAVGAHSPALWVRPGDTAPGAFDNAHDFARHDVIAAARRRPGRFVGPELWVDAGRADPFRAADKAFVTALRAGHVPIRAHLYWSGGHEGSYWRRHWPAYLRFYATALERCR
jgi:S-formylglutathione hydrolase FrmB